MLYLHKKQGDPRGSEIQSALEEMNAGFKLIDSEEESYLRENEMTITGAQIDLFLNDYRRLLEQERSISGDACYLDPETGDVC